MQRNKPFEKLNNYIAQRLCSEKLSENIKELLRIAEEINQKINEEWDVVACNLPAKGKKNKLDEDLVFFVQKKIDEIMKKNESLLDRILESSNVVREYRAGNCQQKTFLALKLLIDGFIENKIADYYRTPSLSIVYTDSKSDQDGHFFININDQVICDPWANLAYPVSYYSYIKNSNDGQDFLSGREKIYFRINSDWECFEAEKEQSNLKQDLRSSGSTYSLFKKDKNIKRQREDDLSDTELNSSITKVDDMEELDYIELEPPPKNPKI